MADEPRPARLDLATAEQISAALTAMANVQRSSAGEPTAEYQSAAGLLAVRSNGDHMVCHYDPAAADIALWDRTLRQQLGDDKARLVRY